MRCAHGHDNPPTSRFCRLCGLELTPQSSHTPRAPGSDREVSTAEVPVVAPPFRSSGIPPGVAPGMPPAAAPLPPPPPAGRDSQRRGWVLGLVGGTAALLAAAIAIAVVVMHGGHSAKSANGRPQQSAATATTANTTSSTAPSSSTAAPTEDRSTIAALEGALTKAGRGRAMLGEFSDHLSSCKVEPGDAAVLDRVIANRRQVAAQARRIAADAHDGSTLPNELAALMDQSAAADSGYLPWVRRSPHTGAACQVPANVSAAQLATVDAKQAFIDHFNPAAAAYNLDAGWTTNNF